MSECHSSSSSLGQDYEVNLRHMKNYLWNSIRQFCRGTGKLISDQNEITGIRTVGFQEATRMQTSLLCEKAYRFTNAKTYVFSDSVLCVGKWEMIPLRIFGRGKFMVFGKQSHQSHELSRWSADGVRVENIPRNHSVGLPREDSKNH